MGYVLLGISCAGLHEPPVRLENCAAYFLCTITSLPALFTLSYLS